MPYSNLPIGVANPGLVVILVDQSSSMSETYAPPHNRAEFAAIAVNRCIYEILAKCRDGQNVRDRCHIAVLGYGLQARNLIVVGRPSDLEARILRFEDLKQRVPDGAGGLVDIDFKLPVWIDATASGSTPMAEAFNFASEMIQAWTRDNPGNFPPVCINITDGEPNDETAAENAARALMQTGTTDGTTLLFNAHIGNPADGEVKMPASEGHLSNQYARFLYRISSGVPQPLEAAARNVGFNVQSGSRGMLMNAGPEALTALIQFGSQHAR